MADLRKLLTDLGFEDVATYLQSGNAVFESADSAGKTRDRVEEALAAAYGFDVPTLVRTGPEMRAVIEGCPYRDAADADPTKVHVTFLDPMPPADSWDSVDLASVAPEEMAVGDEVVYLHLPNGMGRAKLPDLLGRAGPKDVVATTRNWRTVLALADMLEA